MKKNIKTKTHNLYKIIFILVVFLGIGYAFLEANLNINGDVTVEAPELNSYIQGVSVTTGSTSGTPTIIGNDKKEVDFSTALTSDSNSFFEETTTLVNKGSKKAYLKSVDVKVYDSNDNEVTLSAPYEYSLTHGDETSVEPGEELAIAGTQTYKLKFNYISGTNMSTVTDYPTYTFKITYNFTKESFADDSWDTIVTKYSNDPNTYPVGAKKVIQMDLDGDTTPEDYTLRIANTSTPSECSTQGFSQSACGLVIEFADVITTHRMNLYVSGDTTTIGVNSKGGWEYSDMRAYLNSTTYAYENIDYSTSGIFNSLPSDLRSKIIDTTIVSGHNNNDTTNFTTTDKIYLFSTKEIWGKKVTGNAINSDSAEAETRQLDYYASKGVTTRNYSDAIKKDISGADSYWWLRSAYSSSYEIFFCVFNTGNWGAFGSNYPHDVSPAFRIG